MAGRNAATTHRDCVLAQVSREAPCPIVDGKIGAVLHVGAGFGGIVLVVEHCSQGVGKMGINSPLCTNRQSQVKANL